VVVGQGAPVRVHVPLQLSTPVVVWPQTGAEALQLPSGVHPQVPPVSEQSFPQLSLPEVVDSQAGAGALQLPSGTHTVVVVVGAVVVVVGPHDSQEPVAMLQHCPEGHVGLTAEQELSVVPGGQSDPSPHVQEPPVAQLPLLHV